MRIFLIICACYLCLPAFGQDYLRIQNRNTGQYLYVMQGQPALGKVESDRESSRWQKESIAGTNYIRLKNAQTNNHLHNENGLLETGNIQPAWWSAQWVIEPVNGADYVRLKNRNTNGYLHNEKGKLETGNVQPGWGSAHWMLETAADAAQSHDPLPANVRPREPQYYTFNVTNNSMWDVSFRVLFFGARDWTSWKTIKAGFNAPSSHLTGEANQPIRSYEIQWKDITAWKDFPGGMPIIPDNSSMNLTISGNTLTGIKID